LQAQTNSVDIFYKETWAKAWDDCGEPYYNGDRICFPCDSIILARLEVFNYWFQPHPFNNRFHDEMMDLEMMVEELNVKLHIAKIELKDTRKKKVIIAIVSTSTGLILGTIGGIKIGVSIKN
jgi:hypothetical protein